MTSPREAGLDLLADVTRAITEKRTACAARGYTPSDADIARAVLASGAIAESCRRTIDAELARCEPGAMAMLRAGAEAIFADAAQALRADVAEEIASEIEKSVCEPGEQCANRFCKDCVRHEQAKADAATARRIGAAS